MRLKNEGMDERTRVNILLPNDKVAKSLGTKYHIPIGDVWVHAGVGVFVRKKVYQHFETVRKRLSDRMEKISIEDLT